LIFNPLFGICAALGLISAIAVSLYYLILIFFLYFFIIMQGYEQFINDNREAIQFNVWTDRLDAHFDTGYPVDVTTGEVDETARLP
jgi:hypothetical protein